MKFSVGTDYRLPTVVRHQGMVIVLALDENCHIYYRVLALDPAQPDDDKSWSDRKKLGFPDQIRPAGMSLVTVKLETAERTADAPFQAVSDGKHIYLFRQSTDGTLYVDRFVFDPASQTLNPAWEARFQRSRKRDVSASRKDSLGARDMEGEPFFEPTTELAVVNHLQDGRFCVLLLPGRLPSEWRWQIFVTNSAGEIDSFSIGRGEDGLFDMADVQRSHFKWMDTEQQFLAGPAALLYMQQEEAQDEYGRTQRVKRGARVMLAAPVGTSRYALELDGVDDYVSLVKPDSLQIEGDVTIEAWVKPQSADGRQNIVAHGASGVYLRINSGEYQVGAGDHGASSAIPPEDIDTWVHLAGVYEQGAWLLYRNGIEVGPESRPTVAVTVEEGWTIGRRFAGQINNVRLWGCARPGDDIQKDMHRRLAGDEPGLVGYWPIDEGTGDTVHDRASGNHGHIHGYYLELDGTDDYVSIPNHDRINFGKDDDFAVAAWIKPAAEQRDLSYGDNDVIEKWSGSGGYPYVIRYFNQNKGPKRGRIWAARFDGFQTSNNPSVRSKTRIDDGVFHHVAFVKCGSELALHIDGLLEATAEDTTTEDTTNTSPLFIGARGRTGGRQRNFFSGQINNVRIWDRALSTEEIREDMDKPAREVEGAVGNWGFDEGSGDTIHNWASKHHGQLYVGLEDSLNEKWSEVPNDKWAVVPPIAILDFGVSPEGTLALIGELEDRSEVTLALNSDDDAALLCVPVVKTDATQAAMRTIAVDKKGLAVSAGLLNFAHSGDTPFLLDGADGLIHLYFRGDYGQFLVAQHDTLTARAEYTLPLDGTGAADEGLQLHFTARRPGTQIPDYRIAIADGSDGHTCQVTIDNQNGTREDWQNVPRDLESFLAVLNGTATNDANDPLVQEGELAYYDYGSYVQREGVPDLTSTDNPFFGSTLIAVGADNLPDTGVPITVRNVDAAEIDRQEGQDNAWITEPRAKALQFDGADDYVALPHDKLAIPGDLAVEAWVKVTQGMGSSDPLRLINYRSEGGEGPRFTMGLIKDGPDYKVFAASKDKAARTTAAQVSPDEWTHVAAVYNATTALKLDGQGYVDCGNDATLDMTEAMTVEAWVTPERERNNGSQPEEVILSKWGAAKGEQSWRLYIDTDGKPCFETQDPDPQKEVLTVTADAALVPGQPYHLAAVLDASSKEETALAFDGASDYVNLENPDELNFTGEITIEAWIKVQDDTEFRNIVAHGHGDSAEVFLRIHNGVYQIGSWDGQDHKTWYRMPPVDMHTWVHIAGVYDGEQKAWILYHNGIEKSRAPESTGAVRVDDVGWAIGARGTGGERFFKGQINNVRIWDRALSIEEILENMDKLARQVEGTVGHWAFDQDDKQIVGKGGKVQDHSENQNHGTPQGGSFVDSDKCRYEQRILVDGEVSGDPVKVDDEDDDEDKVALTATKVNIGRSASGKGRFQGIIDDVRLWDVGRRECHVHHYRDQPLPGDAEDLVSYWHFEEGRGKTAIDSKGSNHGRLVHPESTDEMEHMWTPAALNATLILYVNGRKVPISDTNLEDHGGYGTTDQFAIGAMIEDKTPRQHMSGCIDEVRVWNEVHSPEQIRDNMYRALSGAEEGLAGYWPLDEREGTTVQDQTGNGQDGALAGPQWIDSTAPIGNEGPEVRNVYGGLEKPGFNKQIVGPPAAVEYGDMQWDDEGNLFGVMKRCYIFEEGRPAALQMVTGFKVGNLELNFVGQIQTAPTLIGYIEGAPPVPSENLTVNEPVADSYVGASAIELTEAKETTQVYSASRDTGFDMSVEFKAGLYWATSAEAGAFIETKWFESEGKVGLHAYFEHSMGHLSSASKTAGTSKTLTKSLTLAGSWEEAHDYDENGQPRYLNPEVGRRYLPNNMGYALVKSGTADLFALRLKRTGSLVAFQVLPNPDIPEDWNIIMFPLNRRYVKNGTLDGMVGLVADPDHPAAMVGERGSYFRPLEAYALKEQIEREAKQIEGYYDGFAKKARPWTGAGGPERELPPGGELGYDWETGRDKRSMANTYVWTADGGFYAEEEQLSSIRQESLGSAYHFLGQAGLYQDIHLAHGVGFFWELDALFGGHINTTISKSKEEKAAFGLHVDVQGEGSLNKWEGDPGRQQGRYTAEPCPGKVDAYRFMTFYLAPKPQNFDRFFEEVVDPEWLNGQGKYAGEYGPNARALREARHKPNEVWRVLHRVTYVSRVPPQFESTPVEAVPKDVRRPANIEANIGLIQEIERIRRLIPPSPEESHLVILGRAADQLLVEDAAGDDQGELADTTPWWAGVPIDIKKEIRQDVMAYLKGYHEIDPARPDWQLAVEYRPGASIIAGSFPRACIQLTVTDPWGNASTVTSGSKLEYGPGGFEVLAPRPVTYTLIFLDQILLVEMKEGMAAIVTLTEKGAPGPSSGG